MHKSCEFCAVQPSKIRRRCSRGCEWRCILFDLQILHSLQIHASAGHVQWPQTNTQRWFGIMSYLFLNLFITTENQKSALDNSNMNELMRNSNELWDQRSRLLSTQIWYNTQCITTWSTSQMPHFRNLVQCLKNLRNLRDEIQNLRPELLQAKREILQHQRKRQQDLWGMVGECGLCGPIVMSFWLSAELQSAAVVILQFAVPSAVIPWERTLHVSVTSYVEPRSVQ